MSKITGVIIDSDGTVACVDVGTSVRELSEAIGAKEAVCIWRNGDICAFVDYDYNAYQPEDDFNAVASDIMSEGDSDGIRVYGSVLFLGDGADDEEPEGLTNEQVIGLINRVEVYGGKER